jgi:hypothetical protein
MLNEFPDGVTSLKPTCVMLNHAGCVPDPLPGVPYTAKPHFVPGKVPVVDTETAGVVVKSTVDAALKSKYMTAVPIVLGSAPGANVPEICEYVAHDMVKLYAAVALFAPNVTVPE